MHNAKMLMEMQHHTQPMQQMEEDIPTVTTPPGYTGKTHFTAEEVKDSWVPKVSFQIFCTILYPTCGSLNQLVFIVLQDPDTWDGGDADTAFNIANGTNQTSYLTSTLINFALVATVFFFGIRKAFPSGLLAAARGVNDIGFSTLVILGGVGTGTGFHLDWTEAYNIAFSVGAAVAADSVLAVWTFINPLLISSADRWIKENLTGLGVPRPKKKARGEQQQSKWLLGFAGSPDNRVHLKGPLLDRFLEAMQKLGSEMGVDNPIVQLQQKAGEMVYVPTGWIHQVVNLSPNVKVAWDYYSPDNFHKYAQLQYRIASKFFRQGMARDYMSFNMVLQELSYK